MYSARSGSEDQVMTIEFEEPSGANPLIEMMMQVCFVVSVRMPSNVGDHTGQVGE